MGNVSKATKGLLSRLRTMADNAACGTILRKSADLCAQMLGSSIPFLHQFLNLSQHLLVNLLASHRATSKLLSVLLSIFTDLASRGFCLPPEIEEGEGEGPTEFEDIKDGGLGEGEGIKDVSDQIESEDQVSLLIDVAGTAHAPGDWWWWRRRRRYYTIVRLSMQRFLSHGRQLEVSFFLFNLSSHNHICFAKYIFSLAATTSLTIYLSIYFWLSIYQ